MRLSECDTEHTSTAKRLLVVGAGRWQTPLIACGKRLGCYVICTDRDPCAPGFQLADASANLDTIDIHGHLRLAERLHIDGVTTMATDYAVPTVAAVANALQLVGNPSSAAFATADKGRMRDMLLKNSIPCPVYIVLDPSKELSTIPLPVVVKPADACGSKGVQRIDRTEDLSAAIEQARRCSRTGRVIVESYLDGDEVSVEGLVSNGRIVHLVVTDKMVGSPPYFVEIGHTIPSRYSAAVQNTVCDLVRGCVAALGIRNSGVHAEVKITRDGPRIVEIASRLGGGYITSDLVPLATDWDIVGDNIRLALGELPHCPTLLSGEQRWAGVRFIPGPEHGILRHIDCSRVDRATVREIEIFKKPGEVLTAQRSSNDRLGAVIATADSAGELSHRLDTALAAIEVDVDH